jgi:hypothetical protein
MNETDILREVLRLLNEKPRMHYNGIKCKDTYELASKIDAWFEKKKIKKEV